MLGRTPFRQIRRIYASILALGRWADQASSRNDEATSALMAHAAATRALAEQIRAPGQTHIAAPASAFTEPVAELPSEAPRLLDQLRRDLLSALESPLLCVDVGARWGADSALLKLKERAKLLCFDPDAQECARLQAGQSIDEVEYVPMALSSDGRDLSLSITTEPACCSIYPPVEALYKDYPALDGMTPERVVSVPSTSIEKVLAHRGLGTPDLYKLDTQGSELDILKGAGGTLSSVFMIDIEVQFNPLYEGAGLFGDVDVFLRSQGFALWRFSELVHYAPASFPLSETTIRAVASPPWRTVQANPGNGQLFWGQAHYVRAECLATDPRRVTATFARRAAVIASAYGYWDLALMVLDKCAETNFEASTLRGLLSLR